MERPAETSRREKRKEARLAKQHNRFVSWIQHQSGKNNKKKKKSSLDSEPQSEIVSSERKIKKMKMSDSLKKGKSKTKFQEFLELEAGKGVLSGEEDLEMEKRMSKKLKVKDRKLRGPDDGINFLIGGSPSEPYSMFDDDTCGGDEVDDDVIEEDVSSMKKKHKKKKKSSDASIEQSEHEVSGGRDEVDDDDDVIEENVSSMKKKHKNKKKLSHASMEQSECEVAVIEKGTPEKVNTSHVEVGQKKRKKKNSLAASEEHPVVDGDAKKLDVLDTEEIHSVEPATVPSVKYMPPQVRARLGIEFDELLEIRRRVKRLLNQLNDSNVESITKEVATIFRSLSRSDGCQIIGQAFLESSTKNESFSAAFAAFVAGMACSVGIDFSAKLIASLARSFEDEYLKENCMFLKNYAKILCDMFIFGVCSSDLIYDLLSVLSKRLAELDVSVIDTILDYCGMKLRGDDPAAMRDFIFNIQNRVNEFRSHSDGTRDGKRSISKMDFMLERICDIKNNKIRLKEVPAHHTRLKKWLQKLRGEDILLRGLKWSKLLDTEKKGQWWISGEVASGIDDVEDMSTTIIKEVVEAQKLVQLAAAQRMNTDIRRAIFCIIMSGEDYLDAFEKLLRLDLTGKQDREIMRVLVECCLQEKVFNKYYTVLASKLCSHDKNNKFSLQYCLWDHFKELESMELNRSMNLARFFAEMLSSFSLSLAILKTVDLTNPMNLTPKRVMHFRMLFEAVFNNSDALVWNIFTRIGAIPELEELRNSLVYFIKQYVVAVSAGKFKIAKKALNNVAGVLM